MEGSNCQSSLTKLSMFCLQLGKKIWVAVHLGPMVEVGEKEVGIPEMTHQVEREDQKSDTTDTY